PASTGASGATTWPARWAAPSWTASRSCAGPGGPATRGPWCSRRPARRSCGAPSPRVRRGSAPLGPAAELAHEPQHVVLHPALAHPPVRAAHHGHAAHGHRTAGGRDAEDAALVRAVHDRARADLVPFGHL